MKNQVAKQKEKGMGLLTNNKQVTRGDSWWWMKNRRTTSGRNEDVEQSREESVLL